MADPKIQTIRADLVLTTGFIATNPVSVGEFPQATFYFKWLNRDSGADSTIEFFQEFSDDKVTWYRETAEDLVKATGVITTRAIERNFVQKAGDGLTDSFEVPTKCPEKFARLQVKQTLGSGALGDLEVKALPQVAGDSRVSDPSIS